MRGEWIEIFTLLGGCGGLYRLSPCGESGLKFADRRPDFAIAGVSLPMRGEWIEMTGPPS